MYAYIYIHANILVHMYIYNYNEYIYICKYISTYIYIYTYVSILISTLFGQILRASIVHIQVMLMPMDFPPMSWAGCWKLSAESAWKRLWQTLGLDGLGWPWGGPWKSGEKDGTSIVDTIW